MASMGCTNFYKPTSYICNDTDSHEPYGMNSSKWGLIQSLGTVKK